MGDAEGGSTGQGVGAGVSVSEERADVAGSEEGERHGAGAEAGIGVMVVVARKVREWMTEGGERVERVGRRYGILGFDKAVKDSSKGGGYSADAKANCARSDGAFGGQAGTSTAGSVPAVVSGDVAEAQSTVDEVAQVAGGRATGAGDRVASAITAYVIVKVRPSLSSSLYLSIVCAGQKSSVAIHTLFHGACDSFPDSGIPKTVYHCLTYSPGI